MARVIFATLSGGPSVNIKAIIGSAIILLINPTQESAQYPNNLSLIFTALTIKVIYSIKSLFLGLLNNPKT
jgi:hypothetical protein